MLFELSSSPKPGNVDRCHDFSDIRFHHFLTSAVSAYPVFRKAASGEGSPGSLILEGVQAWEDWNLRSNTHFGSLVLLIPLALAAGRVAGHEWAVHEQGQETRRDESQENGPYDGVDDGLEEELARVLRSTTVQDAIDFYRAFDLAGARVVQVDDFSLKDPDWERKLIEGNQSLLELMRLSLDHDIVAREWATDFERSFQLAGRLREMVSIYGLNDGVVRTFLEALAEVPDSLISAKFGRERAVEVSSLAVDALLDSTLNKAREMDCELNNRDMNPGSTADLIAASLFISLLRRLRF
jgi:triphosphoribosyl-dephospho-CoA synthase